KADMETWILDLVSGEVRSVFGEGMYSSPGAWSPDGTKLLAVDMRNTSDSSIHVVDLETGDAPELTPHDGFGQYLPGPWAPDGTGFYFLSDEGREFRGLAFYDLAAGRFEWIETPDADIDALACSRDGRVLAWLLNEDGWARLKLRDLEAGRDLPEPDLPRAAHPYALGGLGVPIAVSEDGARAATILSGTRRPPEVWIVDTAAGSARTLTESRIGLPREDYLVEVELVAYPTFDGREIPAWLYRPEVDGRVPVVLSIHGGPQAQERPIYSPLYQ